MAMDIRFMIGCLGMDGAKNESEHIYFLSGFFLVSTNMYEIHDSFLPLDLGCFDLGKHATSLYLP